MFDQPEFPEALAQAIASHASVSSSDFDLNSDRPPAENLRPAAVLVPLQIKGGAWHVILTKRPQTMKHHPGQVAFPGGKQDVSDTSLEATAIRETCEEIGVKAADIKIIAALPNHETVTNFDVSPIVGLVDQRAHLQKERYEVEEVFHVPLAFLFNKQNYSVQSRIWFGSERFYYTIPFGPYYIWGATARMLYSMATIWEMSDAN